MADRHSLGSHVEPAARVIAALDSEQRLQIILRLAERDHVVHELVSSLGKSQPLISQHLRVLKRAGLVSSTRSGREVIYRLAVPEVSDIITLAQRVAAKADDSQRNDLAERASARVAESRAHDEDAASISQKAAIVGYAESDDLSMPGLIPDTPTPPSPRIV